LKCGAENELLEALADQAQFLQLFRSKIDPALLGKLLDETVL
jgi:hypothetical protein